MTEEAPERWLVAAWPGLGQVATTAAIYLLSKLRMHQVAEFRARDLFELESVEVSGGLLHAARLPRSRLFLWRNPDGKREIVVFLGEAQPPTGKLALSQRLLAESRALGVTRVFTFSAMATDMEPSGPSQTYGIASDNSTLAELRRHGVTVLSEGEITGLNGLTLAAAAEAGLPAIGLLGEMPAIAPQLPCPNAAVAVLRVFRELAGLTLDLEELEDYGRTMQAQVSEFYDRMNQALRQASGDEPAAETPPETPPEPAPQKTPTPSETEHIERLFLEARGDRTKAFLLKKELDRLGVFSHYEDRFLNLFEPNQ
ncbi:MAG TPA: PAC2 family protein [Elusimicrobiota bacterium]|nr:PAC2 family protein [Elusimicrobiota bacterium]